MLNIVKAAKLQVHTNRNASSKQTHGSQTNRLALYACHILTSTRDTLKHTHEEMTSECLAIKTEPFSTCVHRGVAEQESWKWIRVCLAHQSFADYQNKPQNESQNREICITCPH